MVLTIHFLSDCLAEPCTTEDGVKCLMPFQYNGVTYSGCTAVDDTKPWCFTVNGNNDYGYCSKSCVTGKFILLHTIGELERQFGGAIGVSHYINRQPLWKSFNYVVQWIGVKNMAYCSILAGSAKTCVVLGWVI